MPYNNAKSREMDLRILKYLCLNCEPLSTVEKPGFEDIFEYALPGSF